MSFIFCVSVQENVAQMQLISHPSNLNTSEDMEDREPLQEEEEEEEEFIVLDPEHVRSFSFDIYTISINSVNRVSLTAPQRELWYQ